jgi:hypothetical protein
MNTIEVDFDVFKELTYHRSSEAVTYNDVIRELLKLEPKKSNPTSETTTDGRDWIAKGVRFHHGTEFRASYKGLIHHGKVENGKLVVNNKCFDSPSAAAKEITHNSVDGWTFWECCKPGSTSWQIIKSLRRQNSSHDFLPH